jgi:drug/metabolite transporter (DMT)-like permease
LAKGKNLVERRIDVVGGTGHGVSADAKADGITSLPAHPPGRPPARPASTARSRQTWRVTAIIGGLAAAVLWAMATLASSRSSRMIGSRVVLAWVMIVGTIVGLPLALTSGIPRDVPSEAIPLLVLAGVCYSAGLYATYTALRIGKVSIIAPIVATEGAVGALIAVALGDVLALTAAALLAVIATGVVLATIEPARPGVPAGDIELAADALDGPATPAEIVAREDAQARIDAHHANDADEAARTRRAVAFAVVAALIFGVGLVAAGKAALLVPPIWVSVTSRMVGLVVVALPLLLQRRLTLTRRALPLVVISGIGEVIGSTASAWGATDSIPISAVLGSQFAAIAAVVAFVLFGERLSRSQIAGVVLIGTGVTALAVSSV